MAVRYANFSSLISSIKQKTPFVRTGFLKKGGDILSHLVPKDETVPSAFDIKRRTASGSEVCEL